MSGFFPRFDAEFVRICVLYCKDTTDPKYTSTTDQLFKVFNPEDGTVDDRFLESLKSHLRVQCHGPSVSLWVDHVRIYDFHRRLLFNEVIQLL